ncbi:MAG: hypothetical protein CMP10_17950 [Zetaproteobacteria bacterium]|nr:hypothetical protein [Pseudobdellovibrionaceae bacterium]
MKRLSGFRSILLSGLIGFSVNGTALGQDAEKAKTEPAAEEVAAKEGETESEVGESEANRKNVKYTVLYESGFGMTLPTSGFNAGYFLKPDQMVDFSYISGGTSSLGWSVIGVGYKWFPGNSMYLHGGLGQRSLKLDIDLGSAELSSLGLDIRLGNRWQWGGFTLGIDWLGYFLPISSSASTSAAIPDNNKDLQDAEAIGQVAHLQLFRLGFGWSF